LLQDAFAVFSIHVFILPGTVLALVAIHLRMVLTKGINRSETRTSGSSRDLRQEYEAIIKKEGIPFAPHGFGRIWWLRQWSSAAFFSARPFSVQRTDGAALSCGHRHASASRFLFHVDLRGGRSDAEYMETLGCW
jgi:hypothetical protein